MFFATLGCSFPSSTGASMSGRAQQSLIVPELASFNLALEEALLKGITHLKKRQVHGSEDHAHNKP